MRESSDASDRISCSHAASVLEKRISEDVLNDQELQALERHLNHCHACRDLVKWMSLLPQFADDLSPAEIDSAHRTMMENRNRPGRAETRRKTRWIIVAAAAAVAGVISVGLFHSLPSKEGGDSNGLLDCRPAPLTEPVPGVFMTYCGDREPGALIEHGGDLTVSLRQGAIGLSVDPNRRNKHKVVVETPKGEVRVKGTVFTVQVDRDIERVEVFRGVVEFVPTSKTDTALEVPAGRGADLVRQETFELTEPETESLRRALDAEKKQRDSAQAEPVLENSPEPDRSSVSGGPAGSRRQVDPVEQALSPEKTARVGTDSASKVIVPSIDALIQDAQSCLIARDWTSASSRYQDILKHYPKSPESTAVLVSLAKIELRRLGRPKEALDHYQIYQNRAPNGPMAEEALFGIALSYRQLGEKNLELKTLRTFVERYPLSSQMEKATSRLHQLETDAQR
jgi:TolA-binding protein